MGCCRDAFWFIQLKAKNIFEINFGPNASVTSGEIKHKQQFSHNKSDSEISWTPLPRALSIECKQMCKSFA